MQGQLIRVSRRLIEVDKSSLPETSDKPAVTYITKNTVQRDGLEPRGYSPLLLEEVPLPSSRFSLTTVHPTQRWDPDLQTIQWPSNLPDTELATLPLPYVTIEPAAELLFEHPTGHWFAIILGFHGYDNPWCSILPSFESQSLTLERTPAFHHKRFLPYLDSAEVRIDKNRKVHVELEQRSGFIAVYVSIREITPY